MCDYSLNTSSRVLLPFLEELGTARALSVAILLRYNDLAGVMSLMTDPRHYVNAESYFRDRQATDLLRKVQGLSIAGVDRKKAAFKKWLDGEFQCYRTNERLAKFNYGGFLQPSDLAILRFLRKVAKTIRKWIGPCPPCLDKIQGRFGPGATFSDRGRLTTVPDKMTSVPTLTHGAMWYILPYLQSYWGRSNSEHHGQVSWVRGNRYLTVPKTALIDRSIAVEPAINVFYQLGLGRSIRQRLATNAGWVLEDAQEIHRRKAKDSSVSRAFCTLDLSNASDTVSLELVRLLLPAKWFDELYALRSPRTLVGKRWHVLEKFSSMGNGYTFELETVIFAALMSVLLTESGHHGVLGDDMFVYGDDIIIPDCLKREAEAVLCFCGFTLNKEKSFSGSIGFRESCGGDFFEGSDVRPFYLKELKNDPREIVPDCNGIRRSLKKLAAITGSNHLGPLDAWLDLLPAEFKRCRGPEQLGDIVLHIDESQWKFKWANGIRYFRAIKVIPGRLAWDHWRGEVVLASALYGAGNGLMGITPRDPPLRYKVSWVPFS
jgi:hypothetical protein